MKVFAAIVIGVVVVALAVGFFVIGTPGEERLRRLDARRINDLSLIQGEILNFWIKKGVLPSNLKELESDLGYFTVPVDPQTKTPYEYKVLGENQFELCANFVTEKKASAGYYVPAPYGFENRWYHGLGRTCFKRTIDPELYKQTGTQGEPPVAVPRL